MIFSEMVITHTITTQIYTPISHLNGPVFIVTHLFLFSVFFISFKYTESNFLIHTLPTTSYSRI